MSLLFKITLYLYLFKYINGRISNEDSHLYRVQAEPARIP